MSAFIRAALSTANLFKEEKYDKILHGLKPTVLLKGLIAVLGTLFISIQSLEGV